MKKKNLGSTIWVQSISQFFSFGYTGIPDPITYNTHCSKNLLQIREQIWHFYRFFSLSPLYILLTYLLT